MPQFDLSTYSSQIFWLVVFFGVFVLAFKNVYWPKILNSLSERQQFMIEGEDLINSYEKKINEIQEERKFKLDEAKEKAHLAISNSLKELHKEQAFHMDLFDKESRKQLDDLEKILLNDREKESDFIESLSCDLAGKILDVFFQNANCCNTNYICEK